MVDEHKEAGGNHDDYQDEGDVEFLEAEQYGETQEPKDTRRFGQRVERNSDVLEGINVSENFINMELISKHLHLYILTSNLWLYQDI